MRGPDAVAAVGGDAAARPRRGYVDWARGLAVAIMIGSHLFDSWTASDDRATREFRWVMLLFIYCIHVEMIYGLISLPLHGTLTLPQAALAFALCSRRSCWRARSRRIGPSSGGWPGATGRREVRPIARRGGFGPID